MKLRMEKSIKFTNLFDKDKKGRIIQEWDGVLSAKGTLYLLEAKHFMTVDKVKAIAERVKEFPEKFEQSSKKGFDVTYSKKNIVGVACGTLFPLKCRKEALKSGLMVIYPSGKRYIVKEGKITSK